jgi:uncharacterized membrane protein YeaQ/YmgE (transglycosylase-associated protein family)
MLIGISGWLLLGIFVGYVTILFVDLGSDDARKEMFVGGAAALIGGWLYCHFTKNNVTAFNPSSLLVAAIAAVSVMGTWHGWRLRTAV